MEKKNEKSSRKKIVTAVIVVVAIAALFWVASVLVANINFVELIRKIHGG